MAIMLVLASIVIFLPLFTRRVLEKTTLSSAEVVLSARERVVFWLPPPIKGRG
jgi:hypothetical protein